MKSYHKWLREVQKKTPDNRQEVSPPWLTIAGLQPQAGKNPLETVNPFQAGKAAKPANPTPLQAASLYVSLRRSPIRWSDKRKREGDGAEVER